VSSNIRLSVVVPAFNEARRLPSTLARMTAFLAQSPRWLPAEIIVVDDGSADSTFGVAGETDPPPGIEIIRLAHSENRGKGAAVRTGFSSAAGEMILLSDADMSTPIAELDRLAEVADGGVAIGSRAVDRSFIETPQPWYRDLMGRVFNLVVRFLAVGGIQDTQCGFKLFDGDLGRELAAVQRLDGFAFDVELLVLARRWGYEVHEIPVRWRHVEASRVQPVTHSWEMLQDLCRIWWWRASGAMTRRARTGR
jgi:dolichyl-phosphate beta-glucosyltransferase